MLQSRSRSIRSLDDLSDMQSKVEFDRSHRVQQTPPMMMLMLLDSSRALELAWCLLVCWPSTIFFLLVLALRESFSLLLLVVLVDRHLDVRDIDDSI